MMHALRHDWAPTAMIVSFKLETDESILLAKVRWAACWCSRLRLFKSADAAYTKEMCTSNPIHAVQLREHAAGVMYMFAT